MRAHAIRFALLILAALSLCGCPPHQTTHAVACPRHLVAVLP